jgi:hypothetical protein
MAESAADLQKQLDSFSEYCNIWRLKVNVEKSKIVVFPQGRTPNNLKFNFNGKQLEFVDEFNYLGVLLTKIIYVGVKFFNCRNSLQTFI